MEIRKASDSDANSVLAISRCVWIDTYATEGVRESIADYIEIAFTHANVLAQISSRKIDVFEEQGHLLGYGALSKSSEDTEIENLYILPKFQGMGYGRKYVSHLQSICPKLWLTCWEKNDSAIQFYHSLGFREAGESFFEMSNEKHRNVLLNYST